MSLTLRKKTQTPLPKRTAENHGTHEYTAKKRTSKLLTGEKEHFHKEHVMLTPGSL